jgi:putative endonuclease
MIKYIRIKRLDQVFVYITFRCTIFKCFSYTLLISKTCTLLNNSAMHYVYILQCNDGSSYTGCTRNLKERFQIHINGYVPATRLKLPVELIFYCAFKDKYKAFEFEKYLKSGSGRAFMNKRLF